MGELLTITERLYNKYGNDGAHFDVVAARRNDNGEWELTVKAVSVKHETEDCASNNSEED